jgi:hypothetical protein
MKSRTRKSMRVASVFTGVAAATVGMTTQAANAQDAAHPAVRPTSRHIGRTVHPAGRVSGSIRMNSDCGNRSIDKNWLHVSTNTGSPILPYESYCFGYKGLFVSPPGVGINYECGGNNHGYLAGFTAAGGSWSAAFGAGTTYRTLHEAHLNEVIINGWAGTDACPKPPFWWE